MCWVSLFIVSMTFTQVSLVSALFHVKWVYINGGHLVGMSQ